VAAELWPPAAASTNGGASTNGHASTNGDASTNGQASTNGHASTNGQASTNGRGSANGHAGNQIEPSALPVGKGIVNRRMILGLAAAGVTGGSVLAEALSTRAGAATTIQPGAPAPAIVTLTDAATIAVDASQGNTSA
jgi:hypothetical protein